MGRCLPKYWDNSPRDARQIVQILTVQCPTDYLFHSLWFVQINSMILRKTTDKTAITAMRRPTKYWKYSTQDFQKILITLSVRRPSKYLGNSRWNTPKYIKRIFRTPHSELWGVRKIWSRQQAFYFKSFPIHHPHSQPQA